jgi:NAD(P)-dependent dehydrogenase (short-subunit alcohol dehydrogenase family)
VGEARKVAIVTGASQGIGAGLVTAFLARGYGVVANSREIAEGAAFPRSDSLALVPGDISDARTSVQIMDSALARFGRVDALVNNAGIFFSKPFIDYTLSDLRALVAVNIEGFLFVTQRVISQLLAQKTGGSIVNITSTAAEHPLATVKASVPMITKGGLEAVTRSLAMEYVKQHVRVNAVAPGSVDTPMTRGAPRELLEALQPTGRVAAVSDIVDAVVYLSEAGQVTGEVLRVDGGSHIGQWWGSPTTD